MREVEIKRSFSNAAKTYSRAAVLQHEVGKRLLTRLDLARINPKKILDLGAGTGLITKKLQDRYKSAEVIAVDISENMLKEIPAPIKTLCADFSKLLFHIREFDLIFANLSLHWCEDFTKALRSIRRILKPDAILLFSVPGPDSLQELRQAFAAIDEYEHVNPFMDMHDIGDLLLQEKFKNPVLSMEKITMHYQKLETLFKDLKEQGVRNIAKNRRRGLMGKDARKIFEDTLENRRLENGKLPLTYEIVFACASGPSNISDKNTGYTIIPLDQIKRK